MSYLNMAISRFSKRMLATSKKTTKRRITSQLAKVLGHGGNISFMMATGSSVQFSLANFPAEKNKLFSVNISRLFNFVHNKLHVYMILLKKKK